MSGTGGVWAVGSWLIASGRELMVKSDIGVFKPGELGALALRWWKAPKVWLRESTFIFQGAAL